MTDTMLVNTSAGPVAARSAGGDGPSIVFCHGNSSSSRCFDRQFDSTLADRFRLIAIDWPGHGASPPASDPAATNTIPSYARVLADVADALGASDGVFVGWSLGGHAVLEAHALIPRAKGLYIFGAPPLSAPLSLERMFHPSPVLGVGLTAESSGADVAQFLAAWFQQGMAVPDVFREDFAATDGRARVALAASLQAEGFDIVRSLSKPLGIVHGVHDRLIQRSYFDTLEIPQLWRRAVQDIPNAGHAPHWDNPAAFNALLEAFVVECATGVVTNQG
jgi:pimeloyl-ACP methyl ester carboxylesterase